MPCLEAVIVDTPCPRWSDVGSSSQVEAAHASVFTVLFRCSSSEFQRPKTKIDPPAPVEEKKTSGKP